MALVSFSMKTRIPSRSLRMSVSGVSTVSSKLKVVALVPVRLFTRPGTLMLMPAMRSGAMPSSVATNRWMRRHTSSSVSRVFSSRKSVCRSIRTGCPTKSTSPMLSSKARMSTPMKQGQASGRTP